jgi:hypothetical protein
MMLIVVVASACSGTHPSAPTSVPPPGQNPQNPLYVTRHFSGVVLTEDGRPVVGAAATDGNGFYQEALYQPAAWTGCPQARVTHPLYEDTEDAMGWDPGQLDVTRNFRLYQSVTLTAGASVHLVMTRDNALCSDDDVTVRRCRKVHVTVPSSGTLVLDTLPDDASLTFWLSIGTSSGYFLQDRDQTVTHVSRSITTATTVVVLVSRPWNTTVAEGFTLNTALAQ